MWNIKQSHKFRRQGIVLQFIMFKKDNDLKLNIDAGSFTFIFDLTIFVFLRFLINNMLLCVCDVSVTFICTHSLITRHFWHLLFCVFVCDIVFHVSYFWCKIIILPQKSSFSIFPKIKEWQTINENDPYVFPCFAQFR